MNLGSIALSARLQANAFLTGVSPELAPGLAVGDFLIDCSDYTGTVYDPYPGAGSSPVPQLRNTTNAPAFYQYFSAFWPGNPSTVTSITLDGTVITLSRPTGTLGMAGGTAAVSVSPESPASDGTYVFKVIRITSVPANPAQAYLGDIYELGVTVPLDAEPDPDPDPDPFNLVPQGESRSFVVDDIDLPTMTDTSLWEIWYHDELLDSGTRFDRFGALGWGVEPSADFTRITVTVPRTALIGEGYDARIRYTGGDFPTTTFIVTPAAEPSEEIPAMPHFLFSTGKLIASLPLPTPTLERRAVGAPAASTQPLANLLDDSLQTVADLKQTDGSNYQYLIADLGSAKKVGRVIAGNVALVGGGTVLAYVSAAKIINGDFSTATALVVGTGAIGNDREYIPAASAPSITGRYVYLVPSAGTGITIGDLDIRSEEWTIGTLQSVGIDSGFQHKELRGGTMYSHYPVADAQFDGTLALSCDSAEFDARSINAFTGALVSAALSNPQTITPSTVTRPPLFVAEFRSEDISQRPFRAVIFNARAPGFTWSLKREDFAAKSFTAATYLPDATRNAWRLYLGQ